MVIVFRLVVLELVSGSTPELPMTLVSGLPSVASELLALDDSERLSEFVPAELGTAGKVRL